jgi:hypothetical protein
VLADRLRGVPTPKPGAAGSAGVVAGALVFGGISLGVQPAIRIAYVYGGLLFFTYPLLASLLAPLGLVVTAHLSRLRAAPVLVVATVFVIGLAGAGVSRVGFAWVQPESFLAEEIAKDPTSPIAVAHEMARKNATTPAFVMVAVDARGRPVLASVAYSLTIFVTVSTTLARMLAFAQSLPSVPETALATAVTVLAGLAGGVLASGAVEQLERVLVRDRGLIAAPAGWLPCVGSSDERSPGASATIAGSSMSFSAGRRPDAVSPVPAQQPPRSEILPGVRHSARTLLHELRQSAPP